MKKDLSQTFYDFLVQYASRSSARLPGIRLRRNFDGVLRFLIREGSPGLGLRTYFDDLISH
jgi:hypothetical protein